MGEDSGWRRAPAFKSLSSLREGRFRQTLGVSNDSRVSSSFVGGPAGNASRGLRQTRRSGGGQDAMQYGSGSLQMPQVECQLAAKYVTSRPIDLPTVPEKTEVDEETARILESMELEKQTCEEDYCTDFEDQVYSISLVEVWMKGYENDVKKLKEAGFSDQVISLAFAALPILSTIPNSDALDSLSAFCTNFDQMKGMGFSQAAIFGSLIKHKNNLEASITGCVEL